MRFPLLPALILTAGAVAALTLALRTGDGAAVGKGDRPKADVGTTGRSIVPCSAAAADWVGALVDPARVAALPEQIEKYSMLRLDPETWKDHPRFYRVDAENVLAYTPDLVLVSPLTNSSTVARMREVGLKILVVQEPTTWPQLLETGEAVAKATGTEARWDAFRSELETRREALRERFPARPLRVLPYGNFGADSYTSGAGSTINLALSLSGHRNHARDLGLESSANISAETLLAEPFDAFVVSGTRAASQSAAALRGNALLQGLVPVAEGRMIYLDDALYASGSFTILDAAEQIAAQGASFVGVAGDPPESPR